MAIPYLYITLMFFVLPRRVSNSGAAVMENCEIIKH
jgi:hypothetical protein